MIPREMSKIAKRRAREFPVLTITGPRQSGKTTLLQALVDEINASGERIALYFTVESV